MFWDVKTIIQIVLSTRINYYHFLGHIKVNRFKKTDYFLSNNNFANIKEYSCLKNIKKFVQSYLILYINVVKHLKAVVSI